MNSLVCALILKPSPISTHTRIHLRTLHTHPGTLTPTLHKHSTRTHIHAHTCTHTHTHARTRTHKQIFTHTTNRVAQVMPLLSGKSACARERDAAQKRTHTHTHSQTCGCSGNAFTARASPPAPESEMRHTKVPTGCLANRRAASSLPTFVYMCVCVCVCVCTCMR
jgi:hypothetical protein